MVIDKFCQFPGKAAPKTGHLDTPGLEEKPGLSTWGIFPTAEE
jgi:hypothetical protein